MAARTIVTIYDDLDRRLARARKRDESASARLSLSFGLHRTLVRATSAALLVGGVVVVPAVVSAPEAFASPATNCSWAATLFTHTADPHAIGETATCTDTPNGEWQLVLYCESYGGNDVTTYGNVVFGSGQSVARCPGSNYEINGLDINNLQ
jgi:hypothetical protein